MALKDYVVLKDGLVNLSEEATALKASIVNLCETNAALKARIAELGEIRHIRYTATLYELVTAYAAVVDHFLRSMLREQGHGR